MSPTDRLIKELGMTRRDFAEHTGLGENGLLRVGQGRMPGLSDGLVRTFERVFAERGIDMYAALGEWYGTPDLRAAYQQWRLQEASKAQLPVNLPRSEGKSPAEVFAGAVGSMSKVAQTLRVNDYVVRLWVKGKTRDLPHQMRESMELCGWPYADELERAQQEWLDER